jgi:hypothetical protein
MLVSDEERRRRLAHRHLLIPAARVETVDEVVETLVALHSSDPVSVYLSAALRMRAPTLADVDEALYGGRRLIRHHAMRRTLWVMSNDVARLAHDGFTRKIAAAERKRMAKLFGLDDDQVAEAIDRVTAVVLDAGEPITTRQVGDALPDLAVPVTVNQGTNYAGTMAVHVRALLLAAFEARIARDRPTGSWIASQYTWVPHGEWSREAWEPGGEVAGAAAVLRSWLVTSAPATLDDLVWWSGSTKTLVRRALEMIGAAEVELAEDTGWVMADDVPDHGTMTPDPGPWVALLPGLDPTAMGWKQRAWYLDAETATRVTDRNGNIGPTVWADGRIVGGWVQRPDGSIAHDADIDGAHVELLQHEIERLRELVGESRFTVRFASPNQKHLLA